MFVQRLSRRQQQGTGTIVYAGGIACGDGALGAQQRLEFGELLKRDIGARMFVFTYADAFGAMPHLYCRYLLGQPTLDVCVRGALLTAPGISVLAGAGNAVLASKVVRGLRHGIDAIARLHHRVNATPSESTVLQFLL